MCVCVDTIDSTHHHKLFRGEEVEEEEEEDVELFDIYFCHSSQI